ncbi:MAG: cyclase family protein [Bacteroidota bacterium]|nr:cyclase family protein [Bacteroidota bacterium]
MITHLNFKGKIFKTDLSQPHDISIPLRAGTHNVNAWYSQPVRIEPVVMGDWIGDVNRGGSVNFRNVFLNPHGNGTHTECAGHISKENYTLNEYLKTFFFFAEVVTVQPEKIGDDSVITRKQLENKLMNSIADALVIRTLPNNTEKLTHHYSNTNPAYLQEEAAVWMVEKGIRHLLLDLPSVDREKDDGKLLAHHAFWKYPGITRLDCTITELIFVPDDVKDGMYLLNIQITSLENDASPSKPVLYSLTESE